VKPRYITTSIAYANAEPHIGFLYELLAADVLARFYRLKGQDVFFLSGTDEHGIKVAKAAKEAGQEPQQFVDELAGKFEALGPKFNLDFDWFIRTTDPRHISFVREKWAQLARAGALKKKTYSGLYCTGCEAFKTAAEIKEGKCLIHHASLEKVEEENWFLEISKNKAQISKWIKKAVFPGSRRQEVINVLESGAYDEVSVSRPKTNNSWGIEVPDDPGQVIYVWVDALFNYLSALSIHGKESLWPADIQVIGKDILKFHAIIWPALLLACGYDLPKKLLVHGFINVEGKKLSKSTGHIVYPDELLKRYGAEATRYLLCRKLNFYDDSNFSWEEFDAIYNGELADGLGNLLQRAITLLKKFEPQGSRGAVTAAFDGLEPLEDYLGKQDFRGQLDKIILEITQANEWLTRQKPWEWDEPDKLKLATFVDQTKLIAIASFLEPFMPKVALKIHRQLKTLDPKPLFPRLAL